MNQHWMKFNDWINVSLWRMNERIELRRIDLIIAATFIICVVLHGYYAGWHGALIGAFMYTLMAMIGLWFLR